MAENLPRLGESNKLWLAIRKIRPEYGIKLVIVHGEWIAANRFENGWAEVSLSVNLAKKKRKISTSVDVTNKSDCTIGISGKF